MIFRIVKYLATPGFFHASPKDINPVKEVMNISRSQSETKKSLDEEVKKKEKVRFREVTREQATSLFKNEVERHSVSEAQMVTRYHQHVIRGIIFLFLGLVALSMPIIGLFFALDVRVPIISYFLPVYTYPVLITMFPTSGVLFMICIWHWYMAKMIMLRQRFPFMQYIKSYRWLPTRSEVVG